MKMQEINQNSVVNHPVYGRGQIVDAWYSRKGALNLAVKFEKGGPMGFAEDATNDISQLTKA